MIFKIIGWFILLSCLYLGMVYSGVEIEKQIKEEQYNKSFVDSVLKQNEAIYFLEKDSAFIQWSNPAIRYAFRKWLKMNPNKNTWNKNK